MKSIVNLAPQSAFTILCVTVLGCPSEFPSGTEGTGSELTTTTSTGMGEMVNTGAGSSISGGTSTSSDGTPVDSTTGFVFECGNGRVEGNEQCDGIDWQGATCESLGQAPGRLSCSNDCSFEISGCVPSGMVLVPSGDFEMGTNSEPNALPIRQVTLDAFWIDKREVTVTEYANCVNAGICSQPGTIINCNWLVSGREDHPVNCTDWHHAEAYCAWVDEGSKRLPTEAEWEKAARGTDARTYPWGSNPQPNCSLVVMDSGCGMDSTMPAGSKILGDSPYSAQDMAGNVWEWVADWYSPSYDASDTINPQGPASGITRANCGGSWPDVDPILLQATYRNNSGPSLIHSSQGFRCARTIPVI